MTENATITGGGGDDIVFGYTGNDSLAGAGGNDTYAFRETGDGTDTINDSSGTDSIYIGTNGAAMTALAFERVNADSPSDSTNDDLAISYNGQTINVLNHYSTTGGSPTPGPGAVESLTFVGGATYLGYALASGPYSVRASREDDGDSNAPVRLDGTTGNDILAASNQDTATTTINGLAGNDLLFGSFATSGTDVLNGGDGNDLLVGGVDNDILNGGNDNDWLVGGTGDDTLNGDAGNDTYVFGLTDGTDTINDSAGSDTIVIATNGAALSALNAYDDSTSTNSDNLVIEYNGQQVTVLDHYQTTTEDVELISFDGGSVYGYALGSGNYTISGSDPADNGSGFRVVSVASGDNFIAGENGNEDSITGGTGKDLLFGGSNNDTLSGGDGNDLLVGGAGADSLNGGTGTDTFAYNATGEAGDTYASGGFTAGAGGDIIAFANGVFDGANYSTSATFTSRVVLSVTGGSGTSISGADLIVFTANNTTDTAGEVDSMLNAQLGQFNGGALIVTDNGANSFLWFDPDCNDAFGGVTLIGTFTGISDASSFALDNFSIA